jgi:nicotinate-nucleotide adenylyltransferase
VSNDPVQSAARVGVLGGCFDPIHNGHLVIAEAARVHGALDYVLFVPTGAPTHKPRGTADAEQRYLMTVLATADHPAFLVSRLEIDRPGPSYTVDTLRALRATYPGVEFALIIGADMAVDFASWREPAAILELAHVMAANRPGVSRERLQRTLHLPEARNMTLLTVPDLQISSTELRARVKAGESLRYLTPEPVAAYIRKHGLYAT